MRIDLEQPLYIAISAIGSHRWWRDERAHIRFWSDLPARRRAGALQGTSFHPRSRRPVEMASNAFLEVT